MTSEKNLTRQEISMIGFEIVAYAGDARSSLLEAIKCARRGEFDKIDGLVRDAQENLNIAHAKQTEMLALEAQGKDLDIGFIMIHAQDHLMTTMLLKDIVYDICEIYKK
ncbi:MULTISPECIES: PTS lactose/cellobiose transporter subunit IIA [Anaerococcus]|uniref:PTS system lactose-specific EIIA component n=1 Tax=Anaerococcus degeneri TaxID=361500 RepID=A0ABS7YXB6_9FIRM|nr:MULTISPECIES: PTS lactose/cellobiose transporter subunit IIA [Anaerococcus]MBP2016053.1 PTS system lactose-specific IIA component [Anaerococcus degeneri]MCA2096381.1 PTS lactose/cellobiose transporter subunit IIA [Anaerococcus degeneri]